MRTAFKERQILLIVMVIGLIVTAALSLPLMLIDWSPVTNIPHLWVGLVEAFFLLLVGHILRAEKMVLLLKPLQPHCRFAVYRCMAIGYLYNLILPLRLGELVRAHLLGRQLMISRSATLLTIIFERIIDSFLLPIFMIVAAVMYGGSTFETVAIIKFFGMGVALVTVLIAFLRPEPQLLSLLRRGTAVLNDQYRDRWRWSIWSGVRFLQIILRRGDWTTYAVFSFFMWMAYLASMLTAVEAVVGQKNLALAVACFMGAILPVGSINLHAYMQGFQMVAHLHMTTGTLIPLLGIMTWCILMLPMSVMGFVFMLWMPPKPVKAQSVMPHELHNLTRHEGMPPEFTTFLENYFGGSPVAHIIDEMESTGQCRNLRIFTGGSHAMTMLVSVGDGMRVRKISPQRFDAKLEAQRQWLEQHRDSKLFAHVQDGFVAADCHVIDIEYHADFIPFFEQIHRVDTNTSIKLMDKLLNEMKLAVWRDGKPVDKPDVVRAYIQKKVIQKVIDASNINAEIQTLGGYDNLVINGASYPKLETSIQRILTDPVILGDLAHYEESDLHGDLTIDNILTNNVDVIVVDPNNENDVNDMVVDIAKLYQSLHSGYEFLRQINAVQIKGNEIKFAEHRSNQYDDIFHYLNQRMAASLPQNRYRAILFHEAVHYCRMLTYRVTINPAAAPAFYAVAVRLFGQFIAQYDDRPSGQV